MTDAEINLAIAKIEFAGKELYPCADHVDIRLGAGDYTCVDYCNNWEDIGPIIEREKIQFVFERQAQIWVAGDDWGDINEVAFAETPTKAAAVCYLKMKGVE